jgi:hypothetical protein
MVYLKTGMRLGHSARNKSVHFNDSRGRGAEERRSGGAEEQRSRGAEESVDKNFLLSLCCLTQTLYRTYLGSLMLS